MYTSWSRFVVRNEHWVRDGTQNQPKDGSKKELSWVLP